MYRNFSLDPPSLDPMQTPIHFVLEFRGVFNIKSSNFWHLLTSSCSFHFTCLQSANVRLSTDCLNNHEKGLLHEILATRKFRDIEVRVVKTLDFIDFTKAHISSHFIFAFLSKKLVSFSFPFLRVAREQTNRSMASFHLAAYNNTIACFLMRVNLELIIMLSAQTIY